MNKYESVIILKPDLTKDELSKIIDYYKEKFQSISNKPISVEDLGKKKLAYEIKGNGEGNYVIFKFNGKGENILDLERDYRINDNVIKFITIRTEEELENDQEECDEEGLE